LQFAEEFVLPDDYFHKARGDLETKRGRLALSLGWKPLISSDRRSREVKKLY
jgi:hypothetical protein